MHLSSSIICAALLSASSVLAGIIMSDSSSPVDITRRGGSEEHSIEILDTRSALPSTDGENIPRLDVRDDDDEDDESLWDDIKDKASDVGDDIKDGASDIKDDVEDEVDDVFDDGARSFRPGVILPGLVAVMVMAVAGM